MNLNDLISYLVHAWDQEKAVNAVSIGQYARDKGLNWWKTLQVCRTLLAQQFLHQHQEQAKRQEETATLQKHILEVGNALMGYRASTWTFAIFSARLEIPGMPWGSHGLKSTFGFWEVHCFPFRSQQKIPQDLLKKGIFHVFFFRLFDSISPLRGFFCESFCWRIQRLRYDAVRKNCRRATQR